MRVRFFLGCITAGAWLGVAACVGDGAVVTPGPDASQPDASGSDGPAPDVATNDAPPAFTPKALPGLALWLEGSLGLDTTGSKVDKWHDQSGNLNDATGANGSVGPTVGLLMSKPSLQFNLDSSLLLKDSTSLEWGTGDFLLEVVASYTNPTTTDAGAAAYTEFYLKQNQAKPQDGVILLGNDSQDKTAKLAVALDETTYEYSSASTLNDGAPRLLGARRKGTTLELRINGVVSATLTNAGVGRDVSAPGLGVRIGGLIGQTGLKGSIAEIIAVKGPTSDNDLSALETYATKKYGL